MFGLRELLLNVLFIIVFTLFIPLIIELKSNHFSKSTKNFFLFLTFSLAIISCITFPITILKHYFFDLRLIPLVMGGLYRGRVYSICLAVVTIGYRCIFGGSGAIATMVMITFTLLLLLLFTEKFYHYSKKKRILTVTLIAFSSSILFVTLSIVFFHVYLEGLFIVFYLVITLISGLLIVYLFEEFHESIYFKQKVIRSEKMEMVSHLASSISHEVRNPLAVVKGFLQLLGQMDVDEAKRKEYLTISINEIDRADKIIRNYLTFAKPSPENIEVLNIKKELLKIVDIITPLANMNSIVIQTSIHPFFIKGESQLIQQCLLNICKNCIEAMPQSGILTIETIENNKKLTITISDTGLGMTKEQMARIGEPYFTTKGRAGTGLGMMAAMQIINSLQGKLHIESKLEEGSIFTIQFPIITP
ncbi:ATP-binding protein [Niallia sp. 03133]|uniref:ATP-binding protein n=1 Tax=Niallia sp. 03133 TaxID=3458060 RepID=UPI004043EDDE